MVARTAEKCWTLVSRWGRAARLIVVAMLAVAMLFLVPVAPAEHMGFATAYLLASSNRREQGAPPHVNVAAAVQPTISGPL